MMINEKLMASLQHLDDDLNNNSPNNMEKTIIVNKVCIATVGISISKELDVYDCYRTLCANISHTCERQHVNGKSTSHLLQ